MKGEVYRWEPRVMAGLRVMIYAMKARRGMVLGRKGVLCWKGTGNPNLDAVGVCGRSVQLVGCDV